MCLGRSGYTRTERLLYVPCEKKGLLRFCSPAGIAHTILHFTMIRTRARRERANAIRPVSGFVAAPPTLPLRIFPAVARVSAYITSSGRAGSSRGLERASGGVQAHYLPFRGFPIKTMSAIEASDRSPLDGLLQQAHYRSGAPFGSTK
jgi:hypothetical protein